MTLPIIRRASIALLIVPGWLPDVPISVWVILGLSRLLEPLVFVAGVVHDEIEDELHASLVEGVAEDIYVGDVAIGRVDYFIVADIIALLFL